MSVLFAHPVLAPWTTDYVEPASFGIETDESAPADISADKILVPVTYRLDCPILSAMLAEARACYALLVSSPRTMVRQLHQNPNNETNNHAIELRISDFAQDITLTPYITTTQETALPIVDGFDPEIKASGRSEFALDAGAVLAVGDGVKIGSDLGHVTSIIDIVASRRVTPGHFMLDFEDTRVKILVYSGDRRALRTMRSGSPIAQSSLYPGLYLHAVTAAIAKIAEYTDSAWASVIRSALQRTGVDDMEDDRLMEEAHIHAQTLLNAPLGHLLNVFGEANDGS